MKSSKNFSVLLVLILASSCSANRYQAQNQEKVTLSSINVKQQLTNKKPVKDYNEHDFETIIKNGNEDDIKNLWLLLKSVSNDKKGIFVYQLAINNSPLFEKFLADGTNINDVIKEAAGDGNKELVDKLLVRGANISIAVQNAAAGNHVQLTKDLIKRGARLDNAIIGVIGGQCQENFSYKNSLLPWLLDKKENNLNGVDLSHIAFYVANSFCFEDAIEVIDMLEKSGAEINKVTIGAVYARNKELLEYLLDKKNEDYNTRLDYAAMAAAKDENYPLMWDMLSRGASKKEVLNVIQRMEKPDQELIKRIKEFKN